MYQLGQEIDVKAWNRERTFEKIMNRAFLFLVSAFFTAGLWMIVDFGVISSLAFLGFGISASVVSDLL